MFCSACGTKINDESRFCVKCGARVLTVVETAKQSANLEPMPADSHREQGAESSNRLGARATRANYDLNGGQSGPPDSPGLLGSADATEMSPTFFGRLWRGEYGLAKTYWLYGVVAGFLLGFLVGFFGGFLQALGVLPDARFLNALLLPYSVVSSVGIWRAAGSYDGPKVWAVLARVAVSFGWVVLLAALVIGVAQPLMRGHIGANSAIESPGPTTQLEPEAPMRLGSPSATEEATLLPAQDPAGSLAEEKVVNVCNWSDYIDPTALEAFTQETGIKVNYDVFDSIEVLETKLLAGNTGYDVVVPSASFMERQIKAGVFRKLDRSKLTNWGNLDPEVLQRVALHDPGNEHAVNHMWGTDGIGYNEGMIKQIDANAPVDSWSIVFDPMWAAKFADCGISVLDAPSEVVGAMLAYLGRDPNSHNDSDLKAAEERLLAIRPYIRMIHSSNYIDALATGEICLAVGWSGDVLQARDRAAQAGQGNVIKYSVPKEGTVIWFDMYAIPIDAPHPDNAHTFINFMMRPEIAAANSNFVNYATGNAASLKLINEYVRDDPSVYPPAEVKAKLFPDLAETPEFTRLLNRSWTRFTTGK